MKDKKKQNQQSQAINVNATQEKIVPKFCTTINIGLLNTKNIVLTMAYSDGTGSAALIERVVIDLDHAKSLNNVLTKLLKEVENVPSGSN